MIIKPGKLLRPDEKKLALIKRIDEIYDAGLGDEFEGLVRSAIRAEEARGRVSEFDVQGTFYVLELSEIPADEHRDIFRRLCNASPCEPLDVEASNGRIVETQLVEKMDFQRLICALMRVVAKLLGLDQNDGIKAPRRLKESGGNALTL